MAGNILRKKRSYYWEVIAPEPFIIDSSVTDEQFISEMVSVSKTSEITELIHSYLQKPTRTFVVFCSENELKKIFNTKSENYKTMIEKQENGWLISVMNKENEFIGRGEIINLGEKMPKNEIEDAMNNHMYNFLERYTDGSSRIKSLMCKMELIKNKMNTTSTVLS